MWMRGHSGAGASAPPPGFRPAWCVRWMRGAGQKPGGSPEGLAH